ncbi:xanthine dehydrogenase accessory protein XdhC [Tabrizicola sp. YIM 78059]|uniref:xanthine dehydrogenase accessory protein XdhC n=1 Tax=Tabrizicola sp. YIM 78059 TaxID=2529861 RepID=UPI0010AB2E78|nr:xanthine dehydrogenase accessory protein XdhC [Tabrizicola sp. YIM 78059]
MFDLSALSAALAAHGRVARVVIAGVEGSSPREVGAAMLVWPGGQSGTIGGGALEYEAAARARDLLARPATPSLPHDGGRGPVGPVIQQNASRFAPPSPRVGEGWGGGATVNRIALGPALGQCCGGAVTLWTEVFDRLPEPMAGVIARGPGAMPLAVKRVMAAARGQGVKPAPDLVQGWLVEPVAAPARQVWVWGAGHVGRALVGVLAPLPGISVTWIDVAPERFPEVVLDSVTVLPAADPALLADHAPPEAEHLVLTFSHALDLELCHRLLHRGFQSCGLIGSATKWARFRLRLAALGHDPAAIARIRCPIGDPSLGKHPQAIAVGVVADLLRAPALQRGEMRA